MSKTFPGKSGSVSVLSLLSSNFLPSLGKILRAVIQEMVFLRILTAVNTRNNGEKFFFNIFVRAAVRHNGNELEYAKSAKSNDFFSRYWPKTSFWAHFGPV